MTSSLNKGEILVVGDNDLVTAAIVLDLFKVGHGVTVMEQRGGVVSAGGIIQDMLCRFEESPLREVYCDVCERSDVERCLYEDFWEADVENLDGIVYAVGNCPSSDFDEEHRFSFLRGLKGEYFPAELAYHVTGFFNVLKTFHSLINNHGHVVIVDSAIIRLTGDDYSPWLHAGYYATARSAQEELVRWLRHDPDLKERDILIHRLLASHLVAPASLDIPYYQEFDKDRPPARFSIKDIARRVNEALKGETSLDEVMVP